MGNFVDGIAVGEGPELSDSPTVAVRISVTEWQTKWMALREITAEEGTPQLHPTREELEESIRAGHADPESDMPHWASSMQARAAHHARRSDHKRKHGGRRHKAG